MEKGPAALRHRRPSGAVQAAAPVLRVHPQACLLSGAIGLTWTEKERGRWAGGLSSPFF